MINNITVIIRWIIKKVKIKLIIIKKKNIYRKRMEKITQEKLSKLIKTVHWRIFQNREFYLGYYNCFKR